MNIGSWNVHGITGEVKEVIQEITKQNMNIVALIETKKKRIETVNNYLHIISGVPKHQRAPRICFDKHKTQARNYRFRSHRRKLNKSEYHH